MDAIRHMTVTDCSINVKLLDSTKAGICIDLNGVNLMKDAVDACHEILRNLLVTNVTAK